MEGTSKICIYEWDADSGRYFLVFCGCESNWECPLPPYNYHGKDFIVFCVPVTTTPDPAYPGYCAFRKDEYGGVQIIEDKCAEGYFCANPIMEFEGVLYLPCVPTSTTSYPNPV